MNYQQPFAAKSLPGVAGGAQHQSSEPITSPTLRDVLNGRGQGVQRHPGNVKYRTLVYVNKVSVCYYCNYFCVLGYILRDENTSCVQNCHSSKIR